MENKFKNPPPKLISLTPYLHRDSVSCSIIYDNTPISNKTTNFFINLETLLKSDLSNTYQNLCMIIDEPSIDLIIENKTKIIETFTQIKFFILPSKIHVYLVNNIPELKDIMKNNIYLETIHAYFEYLNSSWNNTLEDGIIIASLINNFNNIYVDENFVYDNIDVYRRQYIQNNGIKILKQSEYICDNFWLVTQYYVPKDKIRYNEILNTLKNNIKNSLIDKIVLFIETENDMGVLQKQGLDLTKVIIILNNKRLTYSDFFKYVSSTENVPENTIVALANSDIYFDKTLLNLWTINLKNKCLALLRWEHSDEGLSDAKLFGPRSDSQDTWIFHSQTIQYLAKNIWTEKNYETYNYYLGTPGCDNSFTADMVRDKFYLFNPAATIKTYHMHSSNIRNYTNKDLVYRPIYIGINPTYIMEKKNEKILPGKPYISVPYSCDITIKSNNDARATTYVTMLARSKRYVWSPPPTKNSFLKKWQVWRLSGDVFSTQNGIVYDYNNIFIGDMNTDNFWDKANLNTLSRTIKRPNFMAIPVRDTNIFRDKSAFIIHYVGPLMRTLEELSHISDHPKKLSVFWSQEFIDVVQLFKFPISLDIIPWNNHLHIYTQDMFMVPGGYTEVCQETIRALQSNLIHTFPEKRSKTILFLTSSPILTPEYAEKLSANFPKDWQIEIYNQDNPPSYKVLQRAGGIIFWGENNLSKRWENLWALPPGSAMLEFQNEFKLDGEAQFMGSACGLDTRIFILQKATPEYLQSIVTQYITDYFQERQEAD